MGSMLANIGPLTRRYKIKLQVEESEKTQRHDATGMPSQKYISVSSQQNSLKSLNFSRVAD